MHLSLLGRAATLATVFAASTTMLAAQCGIDPNVGTNLGLTDDSVSAQQALGFTFPFAGANYNAVYVASNGFLYLFDTAGSIAPPTDSGCCAGNVAGLLASALPRVCGLWMDLNPTAGGTVSFNALPGKALITWQLVPEYGTTNLNTFQIVLNSSGTIGIAFGPSANATHTMLTGWSPGANAADPGASNLSNRPFSTTSNTCYELFNATTFDLASSNMEAVGTGTNWVVMSPANCASTSEYGRGCPKPCSFYELFAASGFDMSTGSLLFTSMGNGGYVVTACAANCFDTNFATNLNLTDDSVAVGQSLGFTFPYCGASTSAIDVCSNGYIWLASGTGTGADYSPSVAEFMAQPARIAPLWMDLNPTGLVSPAGVYFDALPGKAMVTWNQVPAFGVTGSANTMQVQLFPNGDMIMAWPQALNNQTTGGSAGITGFTVGNGTVDPGSSDVSAVPYSTGIGVPMRLAAAFGSRPVIGTTFNMEASAVRPGTIGGLLSIGATNPNLDLTPAGLPGCTLLATLTLLIPVTTASPITNIALGIPNDPSLVGGVLSSQAIMIDLSVGAVPAYLSNGLQLNVGL